MSTGSQSRFFLAAGVSCLVLASCAVPASGPVAITKVNPYHLQSSNIIRTEDPMIEFEQRRLLHGAIEQSERRDRFGNYFTIFWKSETRNPCVVRFEYRQGGTGLQTRVQEEIVDQPKRTNETKFQVTGEDYQRNGKVTQWKASIVENGAVVAEYKSYLWQ